MVENPPWTGGGPPGVELVETFARKLGAQTVYVRATAPKLPEATKQGEVDAPVGGFTDESPRIREQREAGIRQPCLVARTHVGCAISAGGSTTSRSCR